MAKVLSAVLLMRVESWVLVGCEAVPGVRRVLLPPSSGLNSHVELY